MSKGLGKYPFIVATLFTFFFLVLPFLIYHYVQKYDILSVYSHLDQNPNPVQRPLPSKQNQEYIRILSIEGGGIYGILPAHVLQYLEEKSGRPINQLFDLMVGTSTGSIPIVMLTIPGEGGKPRYTTKDVLNVYNHDADKIFYSPWYNRILTLNGVLGPKYQTSSRYQLLNSYLGNLYFDQLLNNVVLPVYEIYQKTPKLFCNWKNSGIEDQNFMMTNVLLGAISPIAFFPGVVFGSNNERFFLADAGICVNNPALASILLAMKIYPNKKYVLVSLGTGSIEGMKSPSDKMVDWGVLEWSRDIIPIMMDGNVKFNQMLLKKLFPVGIDLHSFNIQVKGVQGALDDISPSNIRKLNKYGKLLIKENKKELDELIPRLQRP